MALVVVTLFAGCGTAKAPLAKSAFYSACSDWSKVVDKSVPDNAVVLKKVGPWSQASFSGESMNHSSGQRYGVSGNAEEIDKFMHALRTDLRKLVQQTGARIDTGGEGKGMNGKLVSFEIQYTAGNAHGKVEADLDTGKAEPDKSSVKAYTLTVEIEEWVR
jgi:hypothetical protein